MGQSKGLSGLQARDEELAGLRPDPMQREELRPEPKAQPAPPPKPPAETMIPVWYPAENNWIACVQAMANDYRQITAEFTGAWSQEQRIAEETRMEQMGDMLYAQSGGRMGRQPQVKMESVQVADIYQDWRFPADGNSWYRGGETTDFSTFPRPGRWKRLQEFISDVPYPRVDPMAGALGIHGGRVYQGAVEDFYLVAGMHAIGMKPQLIANVFVNMDFSNPQLGVFTLRLYKHGQWQHVDIDDALPFSRDYKPLCAQSEFFPDFSWPALIEKAYAKMHGSWQALGGGGHVEEVLTDLTGGCATRFGTCDVAGDRLWQYLYQMQNWCVFACNLNESECGRRNVPIEKHWASSIYRVAKHQGVPYVCVATCAPTGTVRHMPVCDVPSEEGYGIHDGFVWLRIDDFVCFFDTIYECRLVNSDLGPPQMTGIPYSPGWVTGYPWFEELWAFQGDVHNETAPSFVIEVPEAPNEITLEVSQTDVRYDNPDEEPEYGRSMQAPLLLRFYQCSKEAGDMGGGEIYLVHLSAWGHCRDACTGVKVMKPGKYLATVSVPAKYACHRMIFRTYSTLPIKMKPITQHRNWVTVNPAMPLDAIPYSLAGFMRIDSQSEKLPQMFDEAEGRGRPMANAQQQGSTFGGPQHRGMSDQHQWRQHWQEKFAKMGSIVPHSQRVNGQKVAGQFGGRDAIATTNAAEFQDTNCAVM